MYTLVGIGLFALIVIAAILAAFGQLSFSPLALVATLAVFSTFTYTASLLIGKLYGVSAHLRSSFITAAILTLIFTPTLEIQPLIHYAFIGLLAAASKFILTYKGRHIFNPAAIAAFIAGVLGIQYASWWIGTPMLAIPVAIAGFLVLYKTRHLALGGIFLLISIPLITLSGFLNGETLTSALSLSVLSWPILFFVGFMLSEPLTLPPHRWQQLTIAAVVAIIFSLPFHLGDFNSSPQFALIVGNLLVLILAFKQRGGIVLTLKERKNITPTTQEYTFTTTRPTQFEAGQYIELHLPLPLTKEDIRGSRRSFSMTNAPGSKEIKLGIKFYSPSSSFKTVLQTLPVGSTLTTTGTQGDFTLPKDTTQKLLFIAGGIGITPFISHIASTHNNPRDITLLYFIRNPEEAAYKQQLEKSGITVHYFVAESANAPFNLGPYITDEILQKYAPDLKDRAVYISGPPVMVSAAKSLVKPIAKSVKTDYFSGY